MKNRATDEEHFVYLKPSPLPLGTVHAIEGEVRREVQEQALKVIALIADQVDEGLHPHAEGQLHAREAEHSISAESLDEARGPEGGEGGHSVDVKGATSERAEPSERCLRADGSSEVEARGHAGAAGGPLHVQVAHRNMEEVVNLEV